MRWNIFFRYSSSSSSSNAPPRGSLGHHRWFHNQFPPFSPVFHCSLGLGELQACSVPDAFPPPFYFHKQQINRETPHFTFMRWAQNADIHAPIHLNSIGCSKMFFSLCFSFLLVGAFDMHLEPESKKWVKNNFHTAKNAPKQATPFLCY